MKKLLAYIFFSGVCLAGCNKTEILSEGCIKAEYVSASDSPCGGAHKIKIIKGVENIKSFYPGAIIESGSVITANIPQQFCKKGRAIYFTAKPVEPRICTANVTWYLEIEVVNVSANACY